MMLDERFELLIFGGQLLQLFMVFWKLVINIVVFS